MSGYRITRLSALALTCWALCTFSKAQTIQVPNLQGEWVIVSNVYQLGRARLFIPQSGAKAVFIHKGQSGTYNLDCEHGGDRDHLFTAQLQGSSLTGTMILCSDPQQKQMIEDCHMPSLDSQGSLWQTSFKGTLSSYFGPSVGDPVVAPDTNDYVDGTWLAQGWSGGEDNGHYFNCHRDSTDDQDVPFKLERACSFSGSDWVKKYPTDKSLERLSQPFQENVRKFIAALNAAHTAANHLTVTIDATYRPIQRSYLMHYAWQIADQYFQHGNWHNKISVDPRTVIAPPGMPICWVHRDSDGNFDINASKVAAREMIGPNGYGEVPPGAYFDETTDLTSPNWVQPANKVSNHNYLPGHAIDMTITWTGDLTIVDGNGHTVNVTGPPNGAENQDLHHVGASYGVNKLVSDAPHWSDCASGC